MNPGQFIIVSALILGVALCTSAEAAGEAGRTAGWNDLCNDCTETQCCVTSQYFSYVRSHCLDRPAVDYGCTLQAPDADGIYQTSWCPCLPGLVCDFVPVPGNMYGFGFCHNYTESQ